MTRQNKKGQSSIEFVIIVGVMLMVIFGTIGMIEGRMVSAQKLRLYNSMEGLGNVISSEVRLAYAAKGNYSREFLLPSVLSGSNYSLSLNKSEITLYTEETEYVIFLDQEIDGNIGQGKNLIVKSNNDITILSLAG